jgi:hypothetical protein
MKPDFDRASRYVMALLKLALICLLVNYIMTHLPEWVRLIKNHGK